jgi:hypothetical protein
MSKPSPSRFDGPSVCNALRKLTCILADPSPPTDVVKSVFARLKGQPNVLTGPWSAELGAGVVIRAGMEYVRLTISPEHDRFDSCPEIENSQLDIAVKAELLDIWNTVCRCDCDLSLPSRLANVRLDNIRFRADIAKVIELLEGPVNHEPESRSPGFPIGIWVKITGEKEGKTRKWLVGLREKGLAFQDGRKWQVVVSAINDPLMIESLQEQRRLAAERAKATQNRGEERTAKIKASQAATLKRNSGL